MSLTYQICRFEAIESERTVNCMDLHDAGRMDDVTIIVSADVVPTRTCGYERCVFFRL